MAWNELAQQQADRRVLMHGWRPNSDARLLWARIGELRRAALSSRSLVNATLGYGLLEVSSRVVQAISIFVLAYSFPKAAFGHFYGYLAAYQLTTVLSTGGLLESFMSRLTRLDPQESGRERLLVSYVRAYLRRSVLTAAALFLVAEVGYAQFTEGRIDAWILSASLLAGSTYGLAIFIGGYLTCTGENSKSILLRSIYISVSYLVATAMAVVSGKILFFFFGSCAAGLLTVVLAGWIGRGMYPSIFAHTQQEAPPSHGASWFLVPALLNWFFWYGLVVCVSAYFGPERAAELAFTNNVASLLLIINTAISQAWVSRYLRQVMRSPDSAEAKSRFVFRLQSFLMLVASVAAGIAYALLKAAGMPVVSKYANLGLPICLLLFAISLSSPYFSVINSFAVNNQGKRLASISLLAYAGSMAVLFVSARIWGMAGVYAGLALLIVSRGYLVTFYGMRRLGSGFFDVQLCVANVAAFTGFAIYYTHSA